MFDWWISGETLCLRLLNWHICAIQVFPALGLVNFDVSLIIFVDTLLISCRYIGLKFPPTPTFSNSWLRWGKHYIRWRYVTVRYTFFSRTCSKWNTIVSAKINKSALCNLLLENQTQCLTLIIKGINHGEWRHSVMTRKTDRIGLTFTIHTSQMQYNTSQKDKKVEVKNDRFRSTWSSSRLTLQRTVSDMSDT